MPSSTKPKFARGAFTALLAGCAIVLAVLAFPPRRLRADQSAHPGTIEIGGRTRAYFVHTPPAYNGKSPLALVMVLHGGGGNAENAEKMSGMSREADMKNFLVVYPDGTGGLGNRFHTWNSGNCCAYAMKNNVDDVGFLRALIEKLERDYPVDRRRVFVTGMSNGGMMTYRMACEDAAQIAAIAPVAGALSVPCHPANPVSVIAFHGTADKNVPFDGGTGSKQIGGPRDDRPVSYAISLWAKADGCNPTPRRTETADLRTDTYAGCNAGTAVELNAVLGQGHAWPGGDRVLRVLDAPNPNVNATELMWSFFAAHPKQ